MKTKHNILGIVVHGHRIEVSEVERSEGTAKVLKSAAYVLSDGCGLDNLSKDAVGFKSFLKENAFKSRQAVIGLPIIQVFSTIVELPQINDEQLKHDTIGMYLDNKTELNISEVIFAYDEKTNANNGHTLVLAIKKHLVAEIKALLAASKVTPVQILNSSMLFNNTDKNSICCNLVSFNDSIELCMYQGPQLIAVQTYSTQTGNATTLQIAGKIQRYVNRICMSLAIDSENIHYKLISASDQIQSDAAALKGILGEVSCDKVISSCNFEGYISAELGKAALFGKLPVINYLNGRTDHSKPSYLKVHLRKIIYASGVILALVLAFIFSWQWDKSQISQIQQQLDSMKQSTDAATQMVSRVGYSKQWFSNDIKYLEILRQLSNAFSHSTDIWLTSFAIDESLKQILTGRTETEDAVLDLAETLRDNQAFDDVKVLYIRKMGKGSSTMTFAIELICGQE